MSAKKITRTVKVSGELAVIGVKCIMETISPRPHTVTASSFLPEKSAGRAAWSSEGCEDMGGAMGAEGTGPAMGAGNTGSGGASGAGVEGYSGWGFLGWWG